MQSSSKGNWMDLPLKLLIQIVEFLEPNSKDWSHCREMYTSWWRSTSTNSALLPKLVGTSPPEILFSSSVFVIRSHDSGSTPWFVSVAEITKGNINFVHPFLGTPLLNVPANLDLSQCQLPYRLATAYHMADVNYEDCSSALYCYTKALVFSKRYLPGLDDCSQLLLDNHGNLGGYPPLQSWYKEEAEGGNQYVPWIDVSHYSTDRFDDIEAFRGSIHILDQQGTLYRMSNIIFGGLREIVDSSFCKEEGQCMGWRKRLVVSPSGQKLYMIKREIAVLRVYELYAQSDKSGNWVEVQSFGESDNQVLFLSRLYAYFASVTEFPGCKLSNCIIFSHDAFPLYSNSCWKYSEQQDISEEQIQIFRLGEQDGYTFKPISSYPDFPMHIWSPPSWVLQSSREVDEEEDKDEEEEEEEKEEEEEEAMEIESICNSFSESEYMVNTTAFHSSGGAQADAATSLNVVNVVQRVTEEELETENLEDAVFQNDSVVHLFQPSVKEVVTSKFQCIDVQSEHLPVLEKVWIKHGDVLEGSAICSCDAKAMALASLAKVVIILQTNNGNTLTNDQAQYLSSSLSDLQHMHLKVDWLTPSVEKALASHKSKQLRASLEELEKAKAKAEEIEQRFLLEMAEMKQGLDKDIQLLSRKMPASGDVDGENCLGEGLC